MRDVCSATADLASVSSRQSVSVLQSVAVVPSILDGSS